MRREKRTYRGNIEIFVASDNRATIASGTSSTTAKVQGILSTVFTNCVLSEAVPVGSLVNVLKVQRTTVNTSRGGRGC